MTSPAPWFRRNRLLFLLAVCFCVRLTLSLSGGQLFILDEFRYLHSLECFNRISDEGVMSAVDYILEQPSHTGFIFVGLFPTVAHYSLLHLFGADTSFEGFLNTLWISAAFLSLSSLACIALTYALARRVGSTPDEAFLAAVLLGLANTMFYYSRHLLPYDASLSLSLLSLWIGLSHHQNKSRSLLCGLLAGFAFFTYNAYWILGLAVLLAHVLSGQKSLRKILLRGAIASVGFVMLPVLFSLTSLVRGTTPFVTLMVNFSKTVTQGDYSEGWTLPWLYYWHAEHGLLLVWCAGLFIVLWRQVTRTPQRTGRELLWGSMFLGIYFLLILASSGVHLFVVCGRFSRQLLPFLCLAAAAGISSWDGWERLRPTVRRTFWFVVGIQVLFNYSQPIRMRFPADIVREVNESYGQVDRDVTVWGPQVQEQRKKKNRRRSKYVLLNAQSLYPIKGPKPAPLGKTLLWADHPAQFLPLQYENCTPEERCILRATDIRMRLIEVQRDPNRRSKQREKERTSDRE